MLVKERAERRGCQRQAGQVLVLAALLLAVLAGFAALTIDVGLFLRERRLLQNATDAAVLAAVAYLPGDLPAAEAAAREWAARNGVGADAVEAVVFTEGGTRIRVRTRRDVPAVFGRALGFLDFETRAEAVARVGSLNGNTQAMPWGLLQGDSNCLDAVGNAIFGGSCVIKLGAQGAIQGWRGALDFDGTGDSEPQEYLNDIITMQASTVYCVQGSSNPLCQSSTVATRSGNLVGQTRQGIQARLAAEPTCDGSGRDDFEEVFKVNPSGNPSYTVACPNSPRLIILPIVSYSGEPVQTVTIEGWAMAYLEDQSCRGDDDDDDDGDDDDGDDDDGDCHGQGHLEVRITIVDAAYPQSPGFMTDYDPTSGIVLRRLVE